MTPLEVCTVARDELGLAARRAGDTVLENLLEIMTVLDIPTEK